MPNPYLDPRQSGWKKVFNADTGTWEVQRATRYEYDERQWEIAQILGARPDLPKPEKGKTMPINELNRTGQRVPVGSRIKFLRPRHGIPVGTEATVVDDDHTSSQPYEVQPAQPYYRSHGLVWLDRIDFEVISEPGSSNRTGRVPIGTMVVVTKTKHEVPAGSHGKIVSDDGGLSIPYKIEFKGGSSYWYDRCDFTLEEEKEEGKSMPVSQQFKTGVWVRTRVAKTGIPKGSVGRIELNDGSDRPLRVQFDYLNDFDWYREAELEISKEFELEDEVKILTNRKGQRFKNKIGEVTDVITSHDDEPIEVTFEDMDESEWFAPQDLEFVKVPASEAIPEEFKSGVRVETLVPKQAVPTGSTGRIMRTERGSILVGFDHVARHYTPTEIRLYNPAPIATAVSIDEEENTPMAATTKKSFLNLEFGANSDPNLVLTLDGKIAVKRGEDTFAAYAEGDLMETLGELTIEAKGLIFNMPATKEQLAEGDLIKDGNRYLFVKEVTAEGIKTVAPSSASNQSLVNVKNVLGINFYTKVVSFANLGGVGDTGMGGFNPMMLLALKGEGGLGEGDDMLKTMMLMGAMGGQGFPGGANLMGNPMMMMLMLGGKGGDNDMLKMMALSGMMAQQAPAAKPNGRK